jgi:uncharacterized membrane protein
MTRTATIYLAIAVTLFVLDMAWLMWIARDWYQQGIGHLMAARPQLVPAALFYLLFPVGLLVFAVLPGHVVGVARAALLGGLFGFFAYATYDLTNLATLKDWPVGLSMLDVTWGTLAGAAASAVGAWTARALG